MCSVEPLLPTPSSSASPRKIGDTLASVTLDSLVVACQQQVSVDVSGEVVILGMERQQYYGLADVGAFIWSHIQSPIQVRDLCGNILDTYDVNEDQCHADLLAFLNRLHKEGLVEIPDQ